jgi:hypothetical protein
MVERILSIGYIQVEEKLIYVSVYRTENNTMFSVLPQLLQSQSLGYPISADMAAAKYAIRVPGLSNQITQRACDLAL